MPGRDSLMSIPSPPQNSYLVRREECIVKAFLPSPAPLLISWSPRYYGNRKLPTRAAGAHSKGLQWGPRVVAVTLPGSSQALVSLLMGTAGRNRLGSQEAGKSEKGRRQTVMHRMLIMKKSYISYCKKDWKRIITENPNLIHGMR